jgi:hypothetical protein
MTRQLSPETSATPDPKPWAFIALKGNLWGGVCSPEAGEESLGKFMSEMALAGYTIKPVYSREEYEAEWREGK